MKDVSYPKYKEFIKNELSIEIDTELFDPKIDFAFKRIFTYDSKESKIALKDLLNSILRLEDKDSITEITILSPEVLTSSPIEKQAVMDIRVKTGKNHLINIEMQMSNSDNLANRILYYMSKLYSSQKSKGKFYEELKKTVVINIFSFIYFRDKKLKNKYHSIFRYKEVQDNFELTDIQEIHILELKKLQHVLERAEEDVKLLTDEECWALFFKYAADKGKEKLISKLRKRKEGINMAADTLCKISKDEKEKVAYEMHLKWLYDQESRKYYAEKKGFEKGMKKGIEKGIEKGILQSKKEDIFDFVNDLEGNLEKEIIEKINNESDLEKIKKILKIAAKAESLNEFKKKYKKFDDA